MSEPTQKRQSPQQVRHARYVATHRDALRAYNREKQRVYRTQKRGGPPRPRITASVITERECARCRIVKPIGLFVAETGKPADRGYQCLVCWELGRPARRARVVARLMRRAFSIFDDV